MRRMMVDFGSDCAVAVAVALLRFRFRLRLPLPLLPVGLLIMYMTVEPLNRNCMEEPPGQKCMMGEALD